MIVVDSIVKVVSSFHSSTTMNRVEESMPYHKLADKFREFHTDCLILIHTPISSIDNPDDFCG